MDTILTFPLIPRKRISGRGIGEYPGQHRGQGHDFIDKRQYQSSDSMRLIDWKETAKRSAQQGSFAPFVRQFRQDEIMRAVIVVDRSPRMSWYSKPWLSKHQVIVSAGQLIVDSLKKHHGLVGYLDYANGAQNSDPFWRPPKKEIEANRVRNRNLTYGKFTAPENNISIALEWLLDAKDQVPPESFVFLLSDFLAMPEYALLIAATASWDIVPVIIQDPTLEASFPVWRGRIPVYLPQVFGDGQRQTGFIAAGEAKRKMHEHQFRLKKIIELFERLQVHPITLFTADPEQIYESFLGWSALRGGLR